MLRKSGIILKQDGFADARTNGRDEKTTAGMLSFFHAFRGMRAFEGWETF